MSRYASRVDDNQAEIVAQLRLRKCVVVSSAGQGRGFPDIAFNYRGFTFFAEIKDGRKQKAQRKLTPAQAKFHANWPVKVHILECREDVDRLVKAIDAELVGLAQGETKRLDHVLGVATYSHWSEVA